MNNPNPYQSPFQPPPQSPGPFGQPPYREMSVRPVNRTPFILAGIGSLLTSAYWGLLTLLIGFAAATGNTSAFQLFFPVILIGLYAVRGVQVMKGDPAAAKRLIWLHGVGAVVGLTQLTSRESIVVVLYGVKIALHVFGCVTAYLASRAADQSARAY